MILSNLQYLKYFLDQIKFLSQHNSTLNYLNSEKRYQYIKCIATSYHENELLVACGQISKVSIINFEATSENNLEFTPRQNRPALSLAWNQQEQSLIAMGFDKNKFDHCISVWDIKLGAPTENSIVNLIGLSESAQSMVWNGRNLIAGMSQKVIKHMDLRQNPIVNSVSTRAVNGLTLSSHERYLASYFDNVVNIFDLRKFTEPLNQFQLANNLAQISWCPTATNCLLCLQKDSSRTMNIIDIHWTGIDEVMSADTAHFIKRTIAPFEIVDRKNRHQLHSKAIGLDSICWHPKRANNMLVVTNTNTPNHILLELEVPERRIAVFDKFNKLFTPTSTEIKEIPIISPPSSPTNSTTSWYPNAGGDDLSELFQQRIAQDYGLMDFERNAKVCMDPSLASVWKMLAQMENLDCFIGLVFVLGIDPKSSEETKTKALSSVDIRTFYDFPSNSHANVRVYKSEPRDCALELCGWSFNKNEMSSNLQGFLDDLCKKKKFTRASMIAVFQLRIRLACEILGRAANEIEEEKSSYRIAAIALAGFGTGNMWKMQCNAMTQIEDAHLRAIFSFLSDETIAGVLYEEGISLSDRMAFACIFLNDRQLSEYVKFLIQHSITNGNLHGLLLTGATIDGIQLLQAFVDKTDDVQTAALIGAKIMPPQLRESDNRLQTWIEIMRNLMNIWELYEKRAAFDIAIACPTSAPKTPRSIFLLCTFCGKSVSASANEDIRVRNHMQGSKLSACPHCRKPLPRCSLCLLHMGTSLPSSTYNPTNIKSRPVSSWMTWCQSCRHGGHLVHIQEWFKNHQECPVTCCSCKCFSVDTPLLKKEQNELVSHN